MTATHDADRATATVRLELPASDVSIAVGRSVIRRIVTFRDDDATSSFLIAFTEIMANALDEHRRLSSNAPIIVEIEQAPDEIVRVSDSGSGMPTSSEPSTSRPGEASTSGAKFERGRGLAIARAFVDGLEFQSSSAGTQVTLPLVGYGIIR